MIDALWAIPLTLLVYALARRLALIVRHPLCHPLLVSIILIGGFLALTAIPYEHYFAGNLALHRLLEPAVVAMALPLYYQLPKIIRYWRSLLVICGLGSFLAMLSGTWLALWLSGSRDIAASVLAKSVTTPVALALTETVHGHPSITALSVVMVGLLGALFGHGLLRLMGVHNDQAIGLSMGTVSHAIGTARCTEENTVQSAFSTLALVLCSIFTALAAPWVALWLLS